MSFKTCLHRIFVILFFQWVTILLVAQGIRWSEDGNSYYSGNRSGEMLRYELPDMKASKVVSAQELTPAGAKEPVQAMTTFIFKTQKC